MAPTTPLRDSPARATVQALVDRDVADETVVATLRMWIHRRRFLRYRSGRGPPPPASVLAHRTDASFSPAPVVHTPVAVKTAPAGARPAFSLADSPAGSPSRRVRHGRLNAIVRAYRVRVLLGSDKGQDFSLQIRDIHALLADERASRQPGAPRTTFERQLSNQLRTTVAQLITFVETSPFAPLKRRRKVPVVKKRKEKAEAKPAGVDKKEATDAKEATEATSETVGADVGTPPTSPAPMRVTDSPPVPAVAARRAKALAAAEEEAAAAAEAAPSDPAPAAVASEKKKPRHAFLKRKSQHVKPGKKLDLSKVHSLVDTHLEAGPMQPSRAMQQELEKRPEMFEAADRMHHSVDFDADDDEDDDADKTADADVGSNASRASVPPISPVTTNADLRKEGSKLPASRLPRLSDADDSVAYSTAAASPPSAHKSYESSVYETEQLSFESHRQLLTVWDEFKATHGIRVPRSGDDVTPLLDFFPRDNASSLPQLGSASAVFRMYTDEQYWDLLDVLESKLPPSDELVSFVPRASAPDRSMTADEVLRQEMQMRAMEG